MLEHDKEKADQEGQDESGTNEDRKQKEREELRRWLSKYATPAPVTPPDALADKQNEKPSEDKK